MENIIVLGVGNILLQDEGFGVRVSEKLLDTYFFPENATVLDGGTLGMELLRFLSGSRKLIIIDAVDGGKPPGSLYEIRNRDVKAYFSGKISAHELGISEVIASLELLEGPLEEVVIFGVQPKSLDISLDLTPEVAAQLEITAGLVVQQLRQWNINPVLKNA